MTIIATLWNKLAERCFARIGARARDAPGVLGCECASLSGRLINGHADRWPVSSSHGPCSQKPHHQNEYLYGSTDRRQNVSRSAKLERRHKIEVTLIDYLELICIFRVIMGVGNRTNRHSRRCRALMMYLITLPSPPAAGKICKGLSSQIWTINEQTWSRGDVWKWARCRPLSEPKTATVEISLW